MKEFEEKKEKEAQESEVDKETSDAIKKEIADGEEQEDDFKIS